MSCSAESLSSIISLTSPRSSASCSSWAVASLSSAVLMASLASSCTLRMAALDRSAASDLAFSSSFLCSLFHCRRCRSKSRCAFSRSRTYCSLVWRSRSTRRLFMEFSALALTCSSWEANDSLSSDRSNSEASRLARSALVMASCSSVVAATALSVSCSASNDNLFCSCSRIQLLSFSTSFIWRS